MRGGVGCRVGCAGSGASSSRADGVAEGSPSGSAAGEGEGLLDWPAPAAVAQDGLGDCQGPDSNVVDVARCGRVDDDPPVPGPALLSAVAVGWLGADRDDADRGGGKAGVVAVGGQ